MSLGSTRSLLLLLGGAVLLALFPLFVQTPYTLHLLILAMVYAVLASNWDLTLGYAGLFNWAHTAFFALGAYGAGVLSKTFGIDPWISFGGGVLLAVFASLIVALPVMRVKGIYVVLISFAFGQLCLHMVNSLQEYTGGTQGLVLIPNLTFGAFEFVRSSKIAYYYLGLVIFVLSSLYLHWLVTSHFGLSIQALRDNEEYAVSRGISASRQRLLTFVGSAVFTGAIGAYFNFYIGVVSPELFGFTYIATLLSMVLLGGIGTLYGSIIGAFILTFVSESLVDLGPWSAIIIATIIVLVLRFYPEGIIAGLRHLGKTLRR